MAIPEGYEKLAVIGIAYKGEYDPETEYHIMNAVYYEGSTYVALKEHPEGVPTADGANWMYLAKGFIQNMLDTVNAKDTSGLLGEPGGVVSAQTLMDKIADKMTKELVTNTALQNKLANYILKSQIVNNLLATQPGNPLDATQGKILADKFAQLNSELKIKTLTLTGSMNSEIINTDIDQYCYVYKSGLAVTVCMFLHAKNLTGMDTILPDGGIPEEYRAKANLTFNITARDGGQWGTANFIPAAIRFNSSGKVEIATGTEKAKAIYIDGTFSYIAKS